MTKNSIKKQFIQDFGEAYVAFGLPRLMGRIVGLLLYTVQPISLDEIAAQLEMSKGPVSQIMRRLRDHGLIQRIWVPGDRKDYYQADQDIFANAFRNQMQQIKGNLMLADRYCQLAGEEEPENEIFRSRIGEMQEFYKLMIEHYNGFLDAWRK
jgi:DNA-binding transcriptional regulator GbsR (MarR family)